jgi:hypothetical protein
MTRLEKILFHKDPIRFPEDIAKLRLAIPALNPLTDYQVQELYHEFSEDRYCTGWLYLSKETNKEFEEYLNEEMD